MYILGVNFTSHNSAAALVSENGVQAAAEEERFDRHKYSKNFPTGAINYCLQNSGIRVKDLDCVAFFMNPRLSYKLWNIKAGFPKSLFYFPYVLKQIYDHSNQGHIFSNSMDDHNKIPFYYVDHHLAHAASCFLISPFESAVILTVDGRGEYETLCIFHGQGTAIKKKFSVSVPYSIGTLYATITRYLGFAPLQDEFKIMGLASYGTDRLVKDFQDIAWIDDKMQLQLDLKYFDYYYRYGRFSHLYTLALEKRFGPARKWDEPITEHHADVAYAVQNLTEKLILQYINFAHDMTGETNLCMAGGVALNCVANQKAIENGPFHDFFVQPAANDAGTSLGAALSVYYKLSPNSPRFKMQDVFLGPEFTNEEIEVSLSRRTGIITEWVNNPAVTAAELINRGEVIGWFQGRMEFGPRALGSRSILAAPIHAEMKELINSKVKFREEFRPFAPAVLAEYEQEYFMTSPVGQRLYPFMLASVKARPEAAPKIPAVIHVDGTSRIQIVHQKTSPLYWQVISEYGRLSGIPVILNTSFNIQGEPIVCTPDDAINTFLNSGLDYVVIGHFLISKML